MITKETIAAKMASSVIKTVGLTTPRNRVTCDSITVAAMALVVVNKSKSNRRARMTAQLSWLKGGLT
ncbi:hypothetical protein [Planctomyces sp. SH-PL14]|uniref:hypothetical protein n=1 Tax=Planctomyces sp. SH-PL14 TaxID=1632864 RepID=UPI00078B62CA|nr:hypothetical protein [Planctomyces sp. SH-PL14]AMV16386.1 hypothetical protein VT03_00755 [Planctomyces sp. SH-PL14]